MKKAIAKTKVTVRLRKNEQKKEWYLYLESYPVFELNNKQPKRVREYLNKVITTPLWDKTSKARTTTTISYRPKRDVNGIIQCKSTLDKEACIFANKLRIIRQQEYDTQALYSDKDAEMEAQEALSNQNFIDYTKKLSNTRHKTNSKSIKINWERVCKLLVKFAGSNELKFSDLNQKRIEEFRSFLLSSPKDGGKKGIISQNTAATYFSIFKAILKQAFIDGYFTVDIAAKVKGIKEKDSVREYLTIEELNKLASTPSDKAIVKRAALFSALTGLRHSDIQKLKWSEIKVEGNRCLLNFTQQKTKGVEYNPLSSQALALCGTRREPEALVFEDLPDPSWISQPLKKWVLAAGITKKITFHCFRHTYATLQIAGGTDIFTLSKLMGHTSVKTTQIYAKLVDENKNKAADVIKIDFGVMSENPCLNEDKHSDDE